MSPILFLVAIGWPQPDALGPTVGEDCPSVAADSVTDPGMPFEVEVRRLRGDVKVHCWGGRIMTVEVAVEDGVEARKSLVSRWGRPRYEPWVDEYTWQSETTIARLDYVDDPVLSVSDKALLRAWATAKKDALYGGMED